MHVKIQSAVPIDEKKSVLLMGIRVLLYSAVLAGVLLIALLDAQSADFEDKFSEQSYTEYAQECSLLLTTLLFYLSARLFPIQSVVAYLIGGFFGMAYIREHNNFLNSNMAEGAWQVMAYSLAAISAFLVYRQRRHFWKQLNSFMNTRAFGIFITGLMIVFIFSRLYSNKLIWMATMGEENYMHIVARANEEIIELLGYALILLGTIEYFAFLRNSRTE